VDQGQFSDPDFISGTHQRENVQFDDKLHLLLYTVLYLNVLLEGDPTGKFIFKIDDEQDDFILPLFSNIHVFTTKILGQFVARIRKFMGQSDVRHIKTSQIKTIMSVLKTVTHIITNIPARPLGIAVILAIMSVSTFIFAVILYVLKVERNVIIPSPTKLRRDIETLPSAQGCYAVNI
jgi:hypothetical protein